MDQIHLHLYQHVQMLHALPVTKNDVMPTEWLRPKNLSYECDAVFKVYCFPRWKWDTINKMTKHTSARDLFSEFLKISRNYRLICWDIWGKYSWNPWKCQYSIISHALLVHYAKVEKSLYLTHICTSICKIMCEWTSVIPNISLNQLITDKIFHTWSYCWRFSSSFNTCRKIGK